MNIYVGNLKFTSTESEVRALFEQYGSVSSVKIVKDKQTGKSRGFCFVEMLEDNDAKNAIESLNGTDYNGRNIQVNEARERAPRPAQDENSFRRR
jgi:RNA recognition motif-containing protein